MRLRCGRLRPLHALHGFAEDSLQSFRTNGLDDVVVHAGAACALPIHFLPPARQRDDAYVSTLRQSPDALCRFYAVDARHSKIHEDDVWAELAGLLDRLRAVTC